MKKLGLFILISFCSSIAYGQNNSEEVIRLSEPVIQTDTYEVFGEFNDNWDNAVSLSDIIEKENVFLNKEVLVVSDISQVCQKKGCFFVAQTGGKTARITFKDYGFFIPTNTAGKEVTFKGVFTVNELSAEENKHYQEDLTGKSVEKAEAVKEYSIVATSILIPKE